MEVFNETIKQVPSLGVLCMLVLWFLKHLKEERDTVRELKRQLTERDDRLIDDMTHTTGKVSEALGRALTVIERMERRLDEQ